MTKEPFIAHSEITNEIYIVCGTEKYLVTEQVIKAMQDTGRLEQNNEEIFKQFKKKVFLESEDVLGNEMVDSYMITDYLAELMGVEND